MKERPILFSAPMVRAILRGQKTVTRRVVKSDWIQSERPPLETSSGVFHFWSSGEHSCPYGRPGDRLWVRETWYCDHDEVLRGPYLQPADFDLVEARDNGTLVYAADGLTPYECEQPIWKPSIHMPRWASRILLEVTAVRVERLRDISYESARAEGVRNHPDIESGKVEGTILTSKALFECLWCDTYGDDSWFANPGGGVVAVKRVEVANV